MIKKLTFLGTILPFLVFAQFGGFTGTTLPTTLRCDTITNCIIYYGNFIANILFLLIVIGGVIAILIGAFNYILGSKDEGTLKSAKKWIQNGLIAVILGALAYVIVNAVLKSLVG